MGAAVVHKFLGQARRVAAIPPCLRTSGKSWAAYGKREKILVSALSKSARR